MINKKKDSFQLNRKFQKIAIKVSIKYKLNV